MRKWILILSSILFLLLIDSVKADFWDFSGQTPSELSLTGIDSTLGIISEQRLIKDGDHYYHLMHHSSSNPRCEYAKYTGDNMSTQLTDYETIVTGIVHGCSWINYNSTHIKMIFDTEADTTVTRRWIKKSDMSTSDYVFWDYATPTEGIIGMGISEDGSFAIANKTASGTFRLFDPNDTEVGGGLGLPSGYTSIVGMRYFNLTDIEEYWIIFQNASGSDPIRIYLARWDYDQSFVGNVLQVNNLDHWANGDGVDGGYGLLFDAIKQNGLIHVVYHQNETGDSIDTLYFNNILYDQVQQDGWMHKLEEKVNLTLYDSDLDGTEPIMGIYPALAWNAEDLVWNLLYEIVNITETENQNNPYTPKIKFLGETETCNCGSWYNVSTCGNEYENHQKQVRSCYPSNCSDTIQYLDCDEDDPLVNTTKDFYCCVCNSDWKKPEEDSTARCSCSIKIPEACINIKTNATFRTDVSCAGNCWVGDDTKRWHLIVCNPTESCYESDLICEQQNFTVTKNYNEYTAGSTAVADFGMTNTFNCKTSWTLLFFHGWKEYRVLGQLCYTCDRYCGGWKCIKRGFNEYKVRELSDCNINETDVNEENLCIYGCKDGECLAEDEAKRGEGDLDDLGKAMGEPVGQLLSVGLTGMDSMFPSSDLKILGATIITVSVAVGITLMLKKFKMGIIMGLMSMLPITFFFMVRGYYPIWIALLIAIPSVAFIVVLMIGKRE